MRPLRWWHCRLTCGEFLLLTIALCCVREQENLGSAFQVFVIPASSSTGAGKLPHKTAVREEGLSFKTHKEPKTLRWGQGLECGVARQALVQLTSGLVLATTLASPW